MKRLIAAAALSAAAVAAVPAAADAATLTRNHSCYRASTPASVQRKAPDGERVTMTGTGFTPNGLVYLTTGRAVISASTANPVGVFSSRLAPPYITSATRAFVFTAVDRTNPAIQASTRVLLARPRVTLGPASFRPGQRLRVRARGFTRARSLYAHVRRGRYHKNIRVGRLKKCGVLSRKVRIIRRGLHSGHYRVQFDTHRRYRKSRFPRAVFRVRVFRFRLHKASGASAASATPSTGSVKQEWTQVR